MVLKIPRLLLFIYFSCVISWTTKAQNLFFNSDFEELNLCTELNQYCSTAAWFYLKPALTPLIHLAPIPEPLSGKDLLIVPIENVYKQNATRHYVYTRFACPLQKNKQYKFSFYLHTGGLKFQGVDFYMRRKEFLSNNFSVDTIAPSIHFFDSTMIVNVKKWNYVEYIYTATGDEYFCMIGNLSKTKFGFSSANRMNKAGDIFYFMDDISCKPLIPTPYCNNYERNKILTYEQHLRHSERTILEEMPALPEFIVDTITVPSVFFETDKAILKPAFKKLIDNLVLKFKLRNIAKIDIEGHTDNTGTEEHNVELSNNRAVAVMDYLIKKAPQIKDNIFATGKAASFPIADNATIEGRAKNRRVQIILTYTVK